MRKVKIGKFLGQLGLTAVIGAIILSIVSWILGMMTPLAGTFGEFLTAVVSVCFFVWAMKISPGKEEFLTTIPLVVLSIALIDLIRNWLTFIPALVIPFSWVGLAFGLGSVFLATMITKKYILK